MLFFFFSDTSAIPISPMKKLRLRVDMQIAGEPTTSKWYISYSNPSLTLEFKFFILEDIPLHLQVSLKFVLGRSAIIGLFLLFPNLYYTLNFFFSLARSCYCNAAELKLLAKAMSLLYFNDRLVRESY